MANQTFKVGDVVWHLSGGPKMVIVIVYGNNKVNCEWWSHEKEYFANADFLTSSLTIQDPDALDDED